MRNALLAAALFAAPAAVMAEGLNYSFVDARYFSTDSDALSANLMGGTLTGSFALTDTFFVTGDVSYGQTDSDSTDATVTIGSLRGGAHYPLSTALDLVGSAGVVFANVDVDGAESNSETGYLAELGLRFTVIGPFEVGAFYNYQNIDEADTASFVLDAQYHITPQFSAVAGATNSDSLDIYTIGARFNF